ncbi:MAG: tetratricopeptide repeat protein [Desulfomonile sp.]|nr:tetratricopeptide repeat protein [Desulfomonile sp.]
MPQQRSYLILIANMVAALVVGVLAPVTAQERSRPPAARAQPASTDAFTEAKRMLEVGRYPRAVTLLTAAISRGEHLPQAYKLRGLAYERMGVPAKAIKDFSDYIARKPADPQGYILRGDAQNFNLEHEAALKDYTRALELSPRSAEALLGRGLAHAGLERYDEALRDYRAALAVNPNNAETLASMGRAYMLAGRKAEAEQSFQKALQIEANSASKKQVREWLEELRTAATAGEQPSADPARGGAPQQPSRLW